MTLFETPGNGETDGPVIVAEREDAVWIGLNRPTRMNAVSEELYEGILEALASEALMSGAARAVVMYGVGRAFCSGADLKLHADGRNRRAQLAYLSLAQQACQALLDCRVPVICVAHGYAIGAGAELALASDFLIASDDCEFRFPEVGLGAFVGGGITARLPLLIGMPRAKELLLLGSPFTGRQAREWGLAIGTGAPEDLNELTEKLLKRLVNMPTESLRLMKAHLHEPYAVSMRAALWEEWAAMWRRMETAEWEAAIGRETTDRNSHR